MCSFRVCRQIVNLLFIVYLLGFRGTHGEIIDGEQFQISNGMRVRNNNIFDSTVESHRTRCVLRCHGNVLCMAVNYESTTGLCQLSSVGAFPSYVEDKPGWQTITTTEQKPADCYDIITWDSSSTTGVYSIFVESLLLHQDVYCDMDTDGGGWTLFQRRHTGTVNFNKGFSSYQQGFGTADTDYWLGLDMLNAMTQGHSNDLEIQFTDYSGESAFEKYDAFSVGAGPNYQLSLASVTFYNDTQDTAGTLSGGSYTGGIVANTQCQYISSVLAYSSQWDNAGSSANQVTGAPNVYPSHADVAGAWCPPNYSDFEHIEMRIASPLLVTSVTVYETYQPGSLTRIATRDQNGQWQTLWSSTSTSVLTAARAFSPAINSIGEMTTDLRIEMDVRNSWYQVDALQVCGIPSTAPYQTMKYNDGASFTTSDNDVDDNAGNCADIHRGGWWYKDCTSINPNGEYTSSGTPSTYSNGLGGMIVPGWKGTNTMQATKLMFRRK